MDIPLSSSVDTDVFGKSNVTVSATGSNSIIIGPLVTEAISCEEPSWFATFAIISAFAVT